MEIIKDYFWYCFANSIIKLSVLGGYHEEPKPPYILLANHSLN